MKTQRQALLGLSQANKIVDEKLISHNQFYWVLNIEKEKDLEKVIKNCAKGEIIIRKFYRTIFTLFKRANILCHKFQVGAIWAKKWIYKQLNKKFQDTDNIKKYIDNMNDEEFKEFLHISDQEEIEELISGEMISIKELQ